MPYNFPKLLFVNLAYLFVKYCLTEKQFFLTLPTLPHLLTLLALLLHYSEQTRCHVSYKKCNAA